MEYLPIWKKIFFYLTPFVIFFCVMEIGLRILGFGTIGKYSAPEQYFWISDNYLGFRDKANGKYIYNRIKLKPVSTTDKYGYRNGFGWETTSNKPIIVFIGDSTVFCAEVNDTQTGPSEVAKLLAPEFNVRVLNAGVRGYNTVQAERMLLKCVKRFSRIIVAVYVYCGNDYYENLDPLAYSPAKSPYVWWNEDRSIFTERSIRYNSIPQGRSIYLSTINSQPIYLTGINFIKRYSVFFAKLSLLSKDVSKLIKHKIHSSRKFNEIVSYKSDKNHQPNKWIGFHVDQSDDKEVSRFRNFAKKHGATKALVFLLKKMKKICKKNNIFLLTTSFDYNKNAPDKEFAKISSNAGVEYVEMSSCFVDKETSYASLTTRPGKFNPHFGVKGTRTFAKALYPKIKSILKNIDGLQVQVGR